MRFVMNIDAWENYTLKGVTVFKSADIHCLPPYILWGATVLSLGVIKKKK